MDQQKRFYAPSQNDRDELIQAASQSDYATIDTITDRLVQQGMCRPRADTSRMPEWIANRSARCLCGEKPSAECDEEWGGPNCDLGNNPAHAAAAPDIGAQIAAHFRGVFAGAQ